MNLCQLPPRTQGLVDAVEAVGSHDPIARRLGELGFVPGESVEVVALAPFGGDPLLVRVGFTRFALRRSEAARVQVCAGDAA
ncbi:ferrous iron transport protein A [Luteimonas sp. S4-F44]|uniref:FeoA family protein n=1 Tax=Luteimonas sp. S4-F44 TaxID=2925842 RepID=UPI001F53B89D|nr:FeoA family protein [Luteimonas sp. S4-F44]UNK43816.1 ferrous iron transport protein A [Luteimonas sp. S4-F44]